MRPPGRRCQQMLRIVSAFEAAQQTYSAQVAPEYEKKFLRSCFAAVNGTLNLTRFDGNRHFESDPPASSANLSLAGYLVSSSLISFVCLGRAMMPARRL